MSGQFTPGPWFNDPCVTIHGDDHLPCVVDVHGLVVAQMLDDGHSEEECEANAHLIAAAPCLLEACERMVAAIEADQHFIGAEHEALRAAIRQARGDA